MSTYGLCNNGYLEEAADDFYLCSVDNAFDDLATSDVCVARVSEQCMEELRGSFERRSPISALKDMIGQDRSNEIRLCSSLLAGRGTQQLG